LDLLEVFVPESPLSLKQMADLTGMTRNRTMRLAGTLLSRGYLVREPEEGRFRLGPRVMALGQAFTKGLDLASMARPILGRLAEQTGEVALLAIRDGGERVILVKEEGWREVRYTVAVGQRSQIHIGAASKVLLAYGPASLQQEILGRKSLPGLTSKTITDPAGLAAELKIIRSQGYAESEGERIREAAAVSAPVFDSEEQVVGALILAGPVSRMDRNKRRDYAGKVKRAAEELSTRLGSSRPDRPGQEKGKQGSRQ
jgi:DNA-binding IclR family transcriptional regulator